MNNEKNFEKWNKDKQKTHRRSDTNSLYFKEKEVWWSKLGVNIGFEEDGKGEYFQRPILVLRKFNRHSMLVLPLSTKIKPKNKYYFTIDCPDGIQRSVILSQIRLIDIRRLTERMFELEESAFLGIKKAFLDVISDRFFEYSSSQRAR
mgnify:CR=1 FL=1